ncbi:MAG TPA: glutathione peroxidase [Terracidiphilus sp.]|nr:glutathione peroxidase [Terracidiphilus sp.]
MQSMRLTHPPGFSRSSFLLLAFLVACAIAFAEQPAARQTVYDFSLVDLDGKVVPLSTFKGKLLLIVNLASQSVFHDQIAALNDLQKTYGAEGLVVLGIPSSDFGGEELTDPAALRKYYADTVHAAFPVFARASLTGPSEIPLYAFLCDPKQSLPGGEIHWNFSKFLIDRKGEPLARYEAGDDPAELGFHVAIEKALAGKLEKQAAQAKTEASSDDDE